MKHITKAGLIVSALSLATLAQATPPPPGVPEMDAGMAPLAAALIVALVALVKARR